MEVKTIDLSYKIIFSHISEQYDRHKLIKLMELKLYISRTGFKWRKKFLDGCCTIENEPRFFHLLTEKKKKKIR